MKKLLLLGSCVLLCSSAVGQSKELERLGYRLDSRVYDNSWPGASCRTFEYRKGSLRVHFRIVRASNKEIAKSSFDRPSGYAHEHNEPLVLGRGIEATDFGNLGNYYANIRQGVFALQISFQDLSVRDFSSVTLEMVRKKREAHLATLKALVREQLPVAKGLKQPKFVR